MFFSQFDIAFQAVIKLAASAASQEGLGIPEERRLGLWICRHVVWTCQTDVQNSQLGIWTCLLVFRGVLGASPSCVELPVWEGQTASV